MLGIIIGILILYLICKNQDIKQSARMELWYCQYYNEKKDKKILELESRLIDLEEQNAYLQKEVEEQEGIQLNEIMMDHYLEIRNKNKFTNESIAKSWKDEYIQYLENKLKKYEEN